MTDYLMIDKPESRHRIEWEDDQMSEYYFYDKETNRVYSLEQSNIQFLRHIYPENGEKKISYKGKEQVIVFNLEVWQDVVQECLEEVRLSNTEIVKMIRDHNDSWVKEKKKV